MLLNFKPTFTASAVEKLLKNGKTNMDEFAMGSGSKNVQFGEIQNPWRDNDGEICVTGGSSGGTAVSVAAGWALAGLGTDTGGSVRLPATLTGLVGFKPTYGMVSRHGVISLVNALDTVSVVARTVEDAEIVYNAIRGRDWRDSTTNTADHEDRPRRTNGNETESMAGEEKPRSASDATSSASSDDIRSLTIGIPIEYHVEGLEPDILEAWERAAEMLSGIGCRVVKVSLPHTKLAGKCYSVLCCAEVASNMARYDGVRYGHRSVASTDQGSFSFDSMVNQSRSEGLGSDVRERVLMGNFFMLRRHRDEYLEQARRVWRLVCADFNAVFDSGVDVLLTPAALESAPAVRHFTVLDNRLAMVRGDVCTQPASLAGLPSVVLPTALSASRGLPLGLQLVGPRCADDSVLVAARVIERWADFRHRFPFVHEAAVSAAGQ